MYGKKSNLDDELERKLNERKNRSNVEAQAKIAINPPIKNENDSKKYYADKYEERDSDGRYSDDQDDRSYKQRNKKPPSNLKIPNNSGDSIVRHPSKIHHERDSRNSSRNSSTEKEPRRNRSKSELREIEFQWKNIETLGSIPPNDYTITNISQNYDLLVI